MHQQIINSTHYQKSTSSWSQSAPAYLKVSYWKRYFILIFLAKAYFIFMAEAQHSSTSLNLELQELIQSYLHQHSNLTLNALANRSGVAGTTLRRLSQGESKGEVSPHVVLQLVAYIYKERRISKLLETCRGAIVTGKQIGRAHV